MHRLITAMGYGLTNRMEQADCNRIDKITFCEIKKKSEYFIRFETDACWIVLNESDKTSNKVRGEALRIAGINSVVAKAPNCSDFVVPGNGGKQRRKDLDCFDSGIWGKYVGSIIVGFEYSLKNEDELCSILIKEKKTIDGWLFPDLEFSLKRNIELGLNYLIAKGEHGRCSYRVELPLKYTRSVVGHIRGRDIDIDCIAAGSEKPTTLSKGVSRITDAVLTESDDKQSWKLECKTRRYIFQSTLITYTISKGANELYDKLFSPDSIGNRGCLKCRREFKKVANVDKELRYSQSVAKDLCDNIASKLSNILVYQIALASVFVAETSSQSDALTFDRSDSLKTESDNDDLLERIYREAELERLNAELFDEEQDD